jgi:hypothetical protein
LVCALALLPICSAQYIRQQMSTIAAIRDAFMIVFPLRFWF